VKAMSQTVDKGRAKALFLYQKIPTLSFLSQYNHLVKQQYTIFTGDCF